MAYSSITKPTDYFNTQLWTGNSTANRSLTGFGFQPDFVWIKNRDTARYHVLMDAVRGASKIVYSNISNAEVTDTNQLESFDSDGITVGTDNNVNKNGSPHVGWTWKANGTGSSNTDGSITSTVSANTTAGFSIVSYTGNGTSGATVGHGLGVAPKMIITKTRSTIDAWYVYSESLGNTKRLGLNETQAAATSSTYWNNTTPTSSVFTLGNNSGNNGNGTTMIAYCFAEKKGYSKFGSYTGNGNSDGTFVYTGFKPAFVMIKHTNGTSNWTINDTGRDPTNVNNLRLFPNQDVTESSGSDSMDMLSNGFKFRSTDGGNNGSGDTYTYMAFAEEPLVANVGQSIPATAR